MSDVLVVGGGLIGASIARRLAQAGASVLLLDAGDPGGAATPAAGGMLSPLAEAPGPGPFLDLGMESFRMYADFVAALDEATGRDVGYEQAGKLVVATGDDGAEALEQGFAWPIRNGYALERVTGDEARTLEPAVSPAVESAVLIHDDARVDNVLLHSAVLEDARRAGVRFRNGTARELLRRPDGAVHGIRLRDGAVIEAEVVVLAAGCWSPTIAGLPRPLPVSPVRGQMLALRPQRRLFQRTLGRPGGYLVPRPDGRVIIGSTMEREGFAPITTNAGLAGLRALATAVVPALAGLPDAAAWAGLRPATPDGLPIIGADPDAPGLVHASGHFRNGILLTPVTAELVHDVVTGAEPRLDLVPFSAGRFAEGGGPAAPAMVKRAPRSAAAPSTARAGAAAATPSSAPLCDLCGSPMHEIHCKLVCPTCGYKRDCSDP